MQLEGTVHDKDVLFLFRLHCSATMELESQGHSLVPACPLFVFILTFNSALVFHRIARPVTRHTSKHPLNYES